MGLLDYFEKLYKTLLLEQWRLYNLSSLLEFSSPPKFCQVCKHQSASESREGETATTAVIDWTQGQPPSPFHRTVYLVGLCSCVSMWFTNLCSGWKWDFWSSRLLPSCNSPMWYSRGYTQAFSGKLQICLRQGVSLTNLALSLEFFSIFMQENILIQSKVCWKGKIWKEERWWLYFRNKIQSKMKVVKLPGKYL